MPLNGDDASGGVGFENVIEVDLSPGEKTVMDCAMQFVLIRVWADFAVINARRF